MVFAAGFGTRLRPITDHLPKALVPVASVPMLERVIRKLIAAGIDDITVNAHHFAPLIESFLREKDNFGINITLSVENPEPLETGGGIRRARRSLEGSGAFLIHNADILSDLDIESFCSLHRPGDLATLVVSHRETSRYLLFDDDMRLAGWTNVLTGEVKSPYPDFDPSRYRKFSFAGIHIMSDSVFPLMESWPEKFSVIDFYLREAAAHSIRGVEFAGLQLIDVGSPERLAEAEHASFIIR